jgi:hypothetical protein
MKEKNISSLCTHTFFALKWLNKLNKFDFFQFASPCHDLQFYLLKTVTQVTDLLWWDIEGHCSEVHFGVGIHTGHDKEQTCTKQQRVHQHHRHHPPIVTAINLQNSTQVNASLLPKQEYFHAGSLHGQDLSIY